MKKDLYLLRHGQTLFNSKQLISGWSDSPLTATGIEQAKRAAAFLHNRHITFDHAYSSDLSRAVTTARLVEPAIEPDRNQGLREWFFGFYEAERVAIMPQPPFGNYFCQFGGESQADVRKRMFETVQAIMEHDDCRCVLIVSHGRSCKEFIDTVRGDSADPTEKVPGNCGTMHFTYESGRFTLTETFSQEDYAAELNLKEIV